MREGIYVSNKFALSLIGVITVFLFLMFVPVIMSWMSHATVEDLKADLQQHGYTAFADADGDFDVPGDLDVVGDITAGGSYYGDGSHLTGIGSGTGTFDESGSYTPTGSWHFNGPPVFFGDLIADEVTSGSGSFTEIIWDSPDDDSWEGDVESGTSGATLSLGDLCIQGTDEAWVLADADTSGSCVGTLAICILSANSGSPTKVLTRGSISEDALNFSGTPAAKDMLYVGETAGYFQDYAPSDSGDTVRIVGIVKEVTGDITIRFSPEWTHIEVP